MRKEERIVPDKDLKERTKKFALLVRIIERVRNCERETFRGTVDRIRRVGSDLYNNREKVKITFPISAFRFPNSKERIKWEALLTG